MSKRDIFIPPDYRAGKQTNNRLANRLRLDRDFKQGYKKSYRQEKGYIAKEAIAVLFAWLGIRASFAVTE